jgi:predicted Zn-dependent protease
VGRQVAYQAEQQLPLVYDSRVDDYLNTLGNRLAAHAPGPRFPYTYKMVDDRTINAFALPGGPVYINRGTIEAAESEAQLAGVMAHETAHVALRHGTNQASKAYLAQFPLAILGGVIRSPGVGMLAQIGGGFAAQSLFLKYSRNAETQADILGAQILYDSGYDPRALVQFFDTIQARGGHRSTSTFFSNHPNTENRAGRVNQEIQKLGGWSRNLRDDSPEFQEIKRYLQGQSSQGGPMGYDSDRPRLERAPGSGGDQDRGESSAPVDSDRPRLERAPGSGNSGQSGVPPQ